MEVKKLKDISDLKLLEKYDKLVQISDKDIFNFILISLVYYVMYIFNIYLFAISLSVLLFTIMFFAIIYPDKMMDNLKKEIKKRGLWK